MTLIKHAAVHHADSVFDSSKCFDFKGKTYEYLPDHPELDTRDSKGEIIRFREVLEYDDYDYVKNVELVNELEREWELLNSHTPSPL